MFKTPQATVVMSSSPTFSSKLIRLVAQIKMDEDGTLRRPRRVAAQRITQCISCPTKAPSPDAAPSKVSDGARPSSLSNFWNGCLQMEHFSNLEYRFSSLERLSSS
jgi:hypothetical protein